jgi:hypothetical protein
MALQAILLVGLRVWDRAQGPLEFLPAEKLRPRLNVLPAGEVVCKDAEANSSTETWSLAASKVPDIVC